MGAYIRKAKSGLPGHLPFDSRVPLLNARILQIERHVVSRRGGSKPGNHSTGDRTGAGGSARRWPGAKWSVSRNRALGAALVEGVGCKRIADALSRRGGIVEPVASAEDGLVVELEGQPDARSEAILIGL